jgi:hypothetical protein
MTPGFVLCGLLTAAILGLAWLAAFRLGSYLPQHAAQLLIGALWLGQAGRWAYRQVAVNYRLTTRRLLVNRGFFWTANRAVELSAIRQVVVIPGPWPRWLRTGRLQIVLEDPNQPPLVLEGVCDPEQVALKIRTQTRHRWQPQAS